VTDAGLCQPVQRSGHGRIIVTFPTPALPPVLVETPDAGALSRYVELQAVLANLRLALWEEAEGRRPTFAGTGDASWIGSQVRSVITLGAELERELREPAHDLRQAAS